MAVESWAGSINLETRAVELLRKIVARCRKTGSLPSRFSVLRRSRFAWILP